jgi:hypothetical protein
MNGSGMRNTVTYSCLQQFAHFTGTCSHSLLSLSLAFSFAFARFHSLSFALAHIRRHTLMDCARILGGKQSTGIDGMIVGELSGVDDMLKT